MPAANFELETVSIRFIKGDLDALRDIDPTLSTSAHVRRLIHDYVRRQRSNRGPAVGSGQPQAQPSEEANL